MAKKNKPLSPHLSIYKPQISSVLSISHRITGVVNFIGIAFMMWWVLYIAYYAQNYPNTLVYRFFGSELGLLVLAAWTFSIFFHMCTGIRHLFWDIGRGFEVKTMNITGWLAVVTAIILTCGVWGFYYLYLS